jgi:hypothetical protein
MLRHSRRAAFIATWCALLVLAGCSGSEPSRAPAASSAASGRAAATAPPACTDARLVWVPRLERLLLANCLDQEDSSGVERLWSWDGTAWELIEDDGPPGRVVAGIAYDTRRDVLVRYGGLPLDGDACSPETWEWDGQDWREVDATPPPACDHLKLSYDAGAGVTLLVGGGTDEGELVTGTYAWDGEAWRRVADAGPAPRAHHAFVFDAAHGQVLLYGGYDGSQVFEDFWSWDGEGWHELTFVGPGPRSHAGGAVSPDGMLLFGGATGPSTFASLSDETWYLTDGRWRLIEGEGPPARGLPALGYDEARDVFVLYGGFDATGAELADLWEWDGSWSCRMDCG